MKAIQTKYHGPTNYKGSRIGVKAEGLPRKEYSWDYSLDAEDNHKAAAMLYAQEYNWLDKTVLVGGSTDTGYTFIGSGCLAFIFIFACDLLGILYLIYYGWK